MTRHSCLNDTHGLKSYVLIVSPGLESTNREASQPMIMDTTRSRQLTQKFRLNCYRGVRHQDLAITIHYYRSMSRNGHGLSDPLCATLRRSPRGVISQQGTSGYTAEINAKPQVVLAVGVLATERVHLCCVSIRATPVDKNPTYAVAMNAGLIPVFPRAYTRLPVQSWWTDM